MFQRNKIVEDELVWPLSFSLPVKTTTMTSHKHLKETFSRAEFKIWFQPIKNQENVDDVLFNQKSSVWSQSRYIYWGITSVPTFLCACSATYFWCMHPHWMTARFSGRGTCRARTVDHFLPGRLKKVGTWKRKFPQCLRRPVTPLYVSTLWYRILTRRKF
jgi:hypothetical protein